MVTEIVNNANYLGLIGYRDLNRRKSVKNNVENMNNLRYFGGCSSRDSVAAGVSLGEGDWI